MKVLVTGGTGYLGRAVVRALRAKGHAVVVFARTASRAHLDAAAVDGDIRDRAAVDRAAEGCDAVCHMAALVTIWRRRAADFDDVNVGGLRNLLAASASRNQRVLYTSSFLAMAPEGRPDPVEANDYQRTKVAADRLADRAVQEGQELVRVYPGVIYGPGELTEGNLLGRLIADHLAGRLPGLVGGDKQWSCAYVEDVAAGHVAALERGRAGARYLLGGENRTPDDIFAIVSRLTGRPPPRRIPYLAAMAAAIVEEARVGVFGGLPLVTRGAVEIFRHDWPLDSSLAVAELGYTMTPVEEGIARTVASLDQGREARA